MNFTYQPKGTCSRQIDLEIEDGVIRSCKFTGGCQGNTQGLCALIQGQPVDVIIDRLSGIQCGMRGTSCPDQLAKALRAAKQA